MYILHRNKKVSPTAISKFKSFPISDLQKYVKVILLVVRLERHVYTHGSVITIMQVGGGAHLGLTDSQRNNFISSIFFRHSKVNQLVITAMTRFYFTRENFATLSILQR